MSQTDLTAHVRITKIMYGSRLDKAGNLIDGSMMELEGKLNTFNSGDLRRRIAQDTKTRVKLSIGFAEEQETTDEYESGDKNYLGIIKMTDYTKEKERALDPDDTEISAYVEITLPDKLFSEMNLIEAKSIRFATLYDIITNPNEDQKTDGIVAFVKKVFFEIDTGLPSEPKRKQVLFGID